jgi:hypothetical protein
MPKKKKSSFYPVSSLSGKNNFKRFNRIEEDGSVTERVFLNIPDPFERERIICIHYLRHITKHFIGDGVGVNIISRDEPWDFSLDISCGDKFNLEITSIADMDFHFEANKREERFEQCKRKERIPLHELKKLNRLFPDKNVSAIIEGHCNQNVKNDKDVANPYHGEDMVCFISCMPNPAISLEEHIKEAVSKKSNKNHSEKEKTVVIIDNRTSEYDVSDYISASKNLSGYFESIPFPEVWFYTGYCSDDDGNNAEFSFAPLKVTKQQQSILESMAESDDVEADGRIVW